MKHLILVCVLVMGFQVITAPPSSAAVADCLSISAPTVSSNAGMVRATFTVSQICNITASTTIWPVFKISQDPFSSPCVGSALMQNKIFGTQYLGQVTCTLGSGRIGTTSSQLEVWIAWDSSTKFINFSYPIIQSSSGSSSGGAGASSGGTPVAPVVPGCLAAPALPTLTISQDLSGVTFNISSAASGQRTSDFSWNYSLWDSQNNAWDSWAGWKYTGSADAFTKRFDKQPNKTKIVFSVQAGNACGYSSQVRESPTNAGVPIGLEPALDDSAIAINQDASDANADASNNAYSEAISATKAAQDALDAVSALGLQVSALLDTVRQLAEVVAKIKKKV